MLNSSHKGFEMSRTGSRMFRRRMSRIGKFDYEKLIKVDKGQVQDNLWDCFMIKI